MDPVTQIDFDIEAKQAEIDLKLSSGYPALQETEELEELEKRRLYTLLASLR